MKSFTSRVALGVVIIILGVALLLDTLNIANTSAMINEWWPSLVIIGGLILLLNGSKDYVWPLVVIAVGFLLQFSTLGYIDINFWQIIWPVVLIGFGASMLFKRSAALTGKSKVNQGDIVAILGSSDHKNTSDDLRSVKVTAVMGGVKLDLRGSVIEESATIDLFALMGGAEIIVPKGTRVDNKVSAILGGVEDKSDSKVSGKESKGAPKLIIVGEAILGGVEIKN